MRYVPAGHFVTAAWFRFAKAIQAPSRTATAIAAITHLTPTTLLPLAGG